MDLPFRTVGRSSFPSLLLLLGQDGVLLGVLVASLGGLLSEGIQNDFFHNPFLSVHTYQKLLN